jgi:hypothetical protein
MTRVRFRAIAAIVAAFALLVLAACSGDDSSGSSSTSAAKDDKLSTAEYTKLFASNISGKNNPFGATPAEAQCVAKAAVAKVGADRLQEAGLTQDWFDTDTKPATDLTGAEANAIVAAFYGCYNVTERYMEGRAGQPLTPQQQACVAPNTTLREFLPVVLREGAGASLDTQEAQSLVDTLLKCVPAGVVFRNSVKGTLTVTDAQVTCLNTELLSTNDFRNGLVQALLGVVDQSQPPPYADEVSKCLASK